MDPLTVILTAIVTGAAASATEVAGQAVKDGYAGLKALIIRKLGDRADVKDAIDGVEQKPDSEARQAILQEELETARAGADPALVKQSHQLLDLMREQGSVAGSTTQVTVSGSGAAAVGSGAVSAGESGVAVSGDVEGGIRISSGGVTQQ